MAAEDETDSAREEPEETAAQPSVAAENDFGAEQPEPALDAARIESETSNESVPQNGTEAVPDDQPTPRHDANHEAAVETEGALGDEFDPMDVLNAPIEKPEKPKSTHVVKPQPAQSTTEPKTPSDSTTTPAPNGTAGAAMSAMEAMNRPSVPQARATTKTATPSPKATTSRSAPSRSLKELSPGEIATILTERPLYIAFVAIVLLWLVLMGSRGCSDNRVPTYPVRGRVVFADGSPVRTGTIEFESQAFKNTNSNGRINEDGSFVLGTYESDDGAPAGEHRVSVSQWIISDPTVRHEKDHGKPVDPRFSRYETSGLTVTIKEADDNNVTITVEPLVRYDEQQRE